MSEENVQLVRDMMEAWDRREANRVAEFFAPEVELRSAVIGEAEGTVFRGQDGVLRWMREIEEAFSDIRTEIEQLHDVGERVVMVGRTRGTGATSGVLLDVPLGYVFSIRDGRITRATGYLSADAALEAAGLSE